MKCLSTIIVLVLISIPAFAAEIVLEPSADAFVCDCQSNVTNPSLGNQFLGQGQFSACYNRLLVEFDMDEIPAGVTITAAELELHCDSFYGSVSGEMLYSLLIEDWNENNVTHNNCPDSSSEIETSTGWASAGSSHTVDVTAFVQAWYGGTKDNYGILGHSSGTTGTCDNAFYSSRVSSASHRPNLIVEYTGGAVENSSLGETKATFK